jgi:hypothetical protein
MDKICPSLVPAKIFPFNKSKDLAYDGIGIYLITAPFLDILITLSFEPEESSFPDTKASPITLP